MAELAAALGVPELVYLATCNRVEVVLRDFEPATGGELRRRVFASLAGRPVMLEEARRLLFRLDGEAAVRHLFEVASGLDSAQLGEREIQGQVREALALARDAGTAGGMLGALFEEALKVARQVHLTTQLGRGRVSLAEIAGELLLERVRRTPGTVALVGVSPMIRRAAEILLREAVPLVVVNRTLDHAHALLIELGLTEPLGAGVSLEEFRDRPPRVEAVLCATGAPEPVLDRASLERLAARTHSQEPPLVVDMALPCDVEPAVAEAVGIPRVGIDEVSGLARLGHEARKAEAEAALEVVEEALASLKRRLAERALAPVITRINRRFRDTALEGVERLLRRQGLALEGEAREDLERWAETLARRFAHLPTLGLKGLAAEQGMAAVESFLAACEEDLR